MKTKHLRVALSTAWLVALIVAMAFMLSSCAGFQNLPSVCDGIEDSVLCSLADSAEVRIEDIGNAFIVANAFNIGLGVYSKQDAVTVLKELKAFLENPISWAMLYAEVHAKIEEFPGLLEIAEGYFQVLQSMELIQLTDLEIIDGWLTKQIKILGG